MGACRPRPAPWPWWQPRSRCRAARSRSAGGEAVTGAGGESEFLLTRPLSLSTLVLARGLLRSRHRLHQRFFPAACSGRRCPELGPGGRNRRDTHPACRCRRCLELLAGSAGGDRAGAGGADRARASAPTRASSIRLDRLFPGCRPGHGPSLDARQCRAARSRGRGRVPDSRGQLAAFPPRSAHRGAGGEPARSRLGWRDDRPGRAGGNQRRGAGPGLVGRPGLHAAGVGAGRRALGR